MTGALKPILFMALFVVGAAVHGGLRDGVTAFNEREAGYDARTEGLMRLEMHESLDAQADLPNNKSVPARWHLPFGVRVGVPEEPPGYLVGIMEVSIDTYNRVAAFAYQHRGWLSVELIDTAWLTINGLVVFGTAAKYRRPARRLYRQVVP